MGSAGPSDGRCLFSFGIRFNCDRVLPENLAVLTLQAANFMLDIVLFHTRPKLQQFGIMKKITDVASNRFEEKSPSPLKITDRNFGCLLVFKEVPFVHCLLEICLFMASLLGKFDRCVIKGIVRPVPDTLFTQKLISRHILD